MDKAHPFETWPLALMTDTFPSEDGLVRCMHLSTLSNQSLERDIRKIILLECEGDDEKVEDLIIDGGGDE